MQTLKTIVAVATTIAMLGCAAAQAQSDWNTTGSRPSEPHNIAGFEHYSIYGVARPTVADTARGVRFGPSVERIDNLYHATDVFIERQSSGRLEIGTLWVNADTIGSRRFGGNPSIERFMLQVGTTSVIGNTFGSPSVGDIELNSNSMTVNGTPNTAWGTPASFGVNVASNGFVTGTTTVNGGTFTNSGVVSNAILDAAGLFINHHVVENMDFSGGVYTGTGTIENLTLNGGTFNNTGTVNNLTWGRGEGTYTGNVAGNLRFTSESGVFQIVGFADDDSFGFTSPAAASVVDLTNARLSLEASTMFGSTVTNVEDWAAHFAGLGGEPNIITWGQLFGEGASVENWSGIASLEILWGLNEYVIRYSGTEGTWSGLDFLNNSQWLITASGININLTSGATTIPEPATLAIVGLGLVGLGLARRLTRRRN